MVVKQEEPCPVQLYSLFIATVGVTVLHAGAALCSQQDVKIQIPTVIISSALSSWSYFNKTVQFFHNVVSASARKVPSDVTLSLIHI